MKNQEAEGDHWALGKKNMMSNKRYCDFTYQEINIKISLASRAREGEDK